MSEVDFEYLVGVFARLLSEGVCPADVRGIEMEKGKSYKYVTKCLYNAHTKEQMRKGKSGVDEEWVKLCQKLFPNNKFSKGSFSKGPDKYDALEAEFVKSIGK